MATKEHTPTHVLGIGGTASAMTNERDPKTVSVFSFSSLMGHLQGMTERLDGLDKEAVAQAALLLVRKLNFEPDSMLCRGCGCSQYDPCENADTGSCGWAKPGLCTACAKNYN